MARYRRYNYKCVMCEHLEDKVVEFDERDETYVCEKCGHKSKRTWEGAVPTVSTSKTSTTIPAAAAKGRFDGVRRTQALRKAKAEARVNRDRQTEREVDRALKEK